MSEISAAEKASEQLNFLFGAALALGLPSTAIYWIWSGDWRPLLTNFVVCVGLYVLSECADYRKRNLSK